MNGAQKTPGVYVVEKDAFPNSVVEVATAVPAFVGYTEFADDKGKSLNGRPWRISSMAEFIGYFGGPPPEKFKIARRGAHAPAVIHATAPANATAEEARCIDDLNKVRDDAAGIPGVDENTDAFGGKGPDFSLSEGTGFYLALAGARFLLYRSMQLFFQNFGGACYIVSVGTYEDALAGAGLESGIALLENEQEPTLLVIPDAVSLAEAECVELQQAMLFHCGCEMKNRFAILDVFAGFRSNRDNSCVDDFRANTPADFSTFSAAYYPWIHSSIVPESDLSFRNIDDASIADLITLLTLDVRESGAAAKKQESIVIEINKLNGAATLDDAGSNELHKTLSAISPLYGKILAGVQKKLNLLPPGAAIAGIYTMVDDTRGVWKAPANVSLNAVISPAVNITDEEQEDLNVNASGKSINAIRYLIGEGIFVRDARTLDGNSPDWRYVNIRRTMIMLEESIKLASKAYVFEPNVAATWMTIKSMIGNFLTGVWKRGGLAGSSPEDAFTVHVGPGETMTAEDVLEDILRVTVLVAPSRPAEFIEITFQQRMQKS